MNSSSIKPPQRPQTRGASGRGFTSSIRPIPGSMDGQTRTAAEDKSRQKTSNWSCSCRQTKFSSVMDILNFILSWSKWSSLDGPGPFWSRTNCTLSFQYHNFEVYFPWTRWYRVIDIRSRQLRGKLPDEFSKVRTISFRQIFAFCGLNLKYHLMVVEVILSKPWVNARSSNIEFSFQVND